MGWKVTLRENDQKPPRKEGGHTACASTRAARSCSAEAPACAPAAVPEWDPQQASPREDSICARDDIASYMFCGEGERDGAKTDRPRSVHGAPSPRRQRLAPIPRSSLEPLLSPRITSVDGKPLPSPFWAVPPPKIISAAASFDKTQDDLECQAELAYERLHKTEGLHEVKAFTNVLTRLRSNRFHVQPLRMTSIDVQSTYRPRPRAPGRFDIAGPGGGPWRQLAGHQINASILDVNRAFRRPQTMNGRRHNILLQGLSGTEYSLGENGGRRHNVWEPSSVEFEQYIERWDPRLDPDPERVGKRRWSINSSMWGARVLFADAKALYETETFRRGLLLADLQALRADRAFDELVLASSFEETPDSSGLYQDHFYMPPKTPAAVTAVVQVFWAYQEFIYSIFYYYAAMGSGPDLEHINFAEYKLMLDHAKIDVREERALKPRRSFKQRRENSQISFTRNQFLLSLSRLAVSQLGTSIPLWRALERIIEEKLLPNVPVEARESPDDFREAVCYTQSVDDSLRLFEPMLTSIYDTYTDGESAMSVDAWILLCLHCQLASDVLSKRDLRLIFSRSRMWASNTDTRGQLMFVDFLEAIVRVAVLNALPTDAMLKAAGCKYAHLYTDKLKRWGTYGEFLEDNDPRRMAPERRQETSRAVFHLLSIMAGTIARVLALPITGKPQDFVTKRAQSSLFKQRCLASYVRQEAVTGEEDPSPLESGDNNSEDEESGEEDMEDLAQGDSGSADQESGDLEPEEGDQEPGEDNSADDESDDDAGSGPMFRESIYAVGINLMRLRLSQKGLIVKQSENMPSSNTL